MTASERGIDQRVGPGARGLGLVVWKAGMHVRKAMAEVGPDVEDLRRLSAAIRIARDAIEEQTVEGLTSFGAVYKEIRHIKNAEPGTFMPTHRTEHLITVRVWVDVNEVANWIAHRAARSSAWDRAFDPAVETEALLGGIPVEDLAFRIEGGWEGGGRPMGWIPGNVTHYLEDLWVDPGPPF